MISRKAALAAAAVVVVAASTAGCTSASTADSSNKNQGEVVRVIDGDTLVVNFEDQELTVRLLNVDTPETKDPNKPVECLGPEATDFIEDALPPGSTVTLEFDVEREDRYGRTLAGVYDADDRLINAEVARQGLGIPVTYEPNAKFRPPVDAAYEEARDNQAGMYDADVACTVPAMVDALEQTAEQAAAQAEGSSVATAASAAAAVLALARTADTAFDVLDAGAKAGTSMMWAALSDAEKTAFKERAAAAKTQVHERHETLVSIQNERQAVEDEAQRVAAEAEAERAAAAQAEEDRKAAEAAQAEANRVAAEQAEANRIAAEQAEANRRAATPQYVAPPAPEYVAPPAQSGPPGYTGPRCYAPGGQSWRPC
ncbi:thermonuclease family protein [Arthrobacter zhaoxinii]|uniref:Thermonuclease family protein n=1 Tax=Arthrobacter zhaoxinii TaxID=2964616 RepID=A0ABY5YRI3_9MICC|nr:thermonuclease family protein [Arthrobacter zhaoxinii]UWX97716.1 thermonuclease family protein [Arthrobacter zhaoxinii]